MVERSLTVVGGCYPSHGVPIPIVSGRQPPTSQRMSCSAQRSGREEVERSLTVVGGCLPPGREVVGSCYPSHGDPIPIVGGRELPTTRAHSPLRTATCPLGQAPKGRGRREKKKKKKRELEERKDEGACAHSRFSMYFIVTDLGRFLK